MPDACAFFFHALVQIAKELLFTFIKLDVQTHFRKVYSKTCLLQNQTLTFLFLFI